jgi:hypothetical protein
MTNGQVLGLAKQYSIGAGGKYFAPDADLIRFAQEIERLAREDMREQCAKVCADFGGFKDGHSCAEAIRNLEV